MGRRLAFLMMAVLAVALLATLLPTLNHGSQQQVLARTLRLALLEREIPDYHMLARQGNIVLSSENITADLQKTVAELGLTLMTPEQVQEKADSEGDFLCLKFSQVQIGFFRSSVSLDNMWVRSQDSTQGYLSGGGMKISFYNLLGRWLPSPMMQVRWEALQMEYRLADISLRAVNRNDLDEVARMWNFGKGEISPAEAVKATEWMQANHAQNRPGRIVHVCFGVFLNSTSSIIGWCGLDGRSGETVDIFYLIDPNHRRCGYATECARRMLEFGFSRMEIERIDGGCALDNLASRRILEKIGMKPTAGEPGILRYYLTRDAYAGTVLS